MTARTHWTGGPGASSAAHTFARILLILLVIVTLLVPPTGAQEPAQTSELATRKPDAKKAKNAYEQGASAERQSDWDTAYTAYSDAASWAPDNRQYALHREIAKSRVVQSKMDAAERDAISGRLDAALKELLSASFIDPGSAVVRERLAELAAIEPGERPKLVHEELAGEPRLAYQEGRRNFDYRGDTQGAYTELGRQFGVEAAFDVDLHVRQIRFHIDDVDFPTAARLLGNMTGSFWRPLSPRLFFVADNTPQKRKDYEASVVRTVVLPASETPEQMTEITRLVREIAGIPRTGLDPRTRTLTMRASPHAVALATDLIDDLERPTGELILEIEVLEVDRNLARQLGITPPQTASIYLLSSQQIQEAESSEQGLINVIQQIFGTLTPNVIAFGGGNTIFLATLPGATADFAQMLSLVRQGRRILLRAQDGKPATFFVGDRIPVSLSSFAPSLLNGTVTPSPITNPLGNYFVGKSPAFVTSTVLRGNSVINDLIVANSADNTVGVLFGNGDGTFQAQVAYPLGADIDPVWIATGSFNSTIDQTVDLAVANKGSNTVSILLGQMDTTGTATGTFVLGTDVPTGVAPVAVIAADFHDLAATGFLDLAVANQGDNTISIFQGNGNGTFSPPTTQPVTTIQLAAGFAPTAFTAVNLTNSGHTDLVVTEQSNVANAAGQVQVFLGNGDGSFNQAPGSPYVVGNTPTSVVTADFNGDGVLDLAVANSGAPSSTVAGNSVSILFGNPNPNQISTGNGTFTAQTTYPAGNGPTSLAAADYNQDSLIDLAVADATDNAVKLLFNEGKGVFTSPLPQIPVTSDPVSIVAADFNQDGVQDVATAGKADNEVTVILNSVNLFGPGINSSSVPFPGAEYLDIGLKVKATPRIHGNDEVTLDLAFENSSLTSQSFNSIPVISNESVSQTVRLKQNQTAVVAGFRQRQLSNSMTGNPGVSQIPVLGLFDQNQGAQGQDAEVLVLVTPRLVRLAPRQDHVVYAGQGSLEGPGGGGGEASPAFIPPPGLQPPAPGPTPPPAQQPTPPPGQQPAPQRPPDQ
jgi:hypothetical protein